MRIEIWTKVFEREPNAILDEMKELLKEKQLSLSYCDHSFDLMILIH